MHGVQLEGTCIGKERWTAMAREGTMDRPDHGEENGGRSQHNSELGVRYVMLGCMSPGAERKRGDEGAV